MSSAGGRFIVGRMSLCTAVSDFSKSTPNLLNDLLNINIDSGVPQTSALQNYYWPVECIDLILVTTLS